MYQVALFIEYNYFIIDQNKKFFKKLTSVNCCFIYVLLNNIINYVHCSDFVIIINYIIYYYIKVYYKYYPVTSSYISIP